MTAGRSPVELLDTLDALRAEATPGPWRTGGSGIVADLEYVAMGVRTDPDAACIVAEHNAVPALVAALRAVLELADEDDARRDDYGYRIRNGLDPSPGDRIRTTVAAALAPKGGQAE